jgi:hypothetical protein
MANIEDEQRTVMKNQSRKEENQSKDASLH